MIFLACMLLATPSAVLAGADIANLTKSIDYSDTGFVKKPILKGQPVCHFSVCFQERPRAESPHHPN